MIGRARPLLLLDVDGVLDPYPGCPVGDEEHVLFPGDDEPVRLAPAHGPWLRELAGRFALARATSWGEEANALLCPRLGLPPLPPVPFAPADKMTPIAHAARGRAAAWLDDRVTPEALAWADGRAEPTLVLAVDPARGLERAAVDRLLAWAAALPDGAIGAAR